MLFPIIIALRLSFLSLVRTVTRTWFVVPAVGNAAVLG